MTSAYLPDAYIDHSCIRFSHRICRFDVRLSNWESSEIGETRRLTLSPGGTSLVYPHSTRMWALVALREPPRESADSPTVR